MGKRGNMNDSAKQTHLPTDTQKRFALADDGLAGIRVQRHVENKHEVELLL